MASVELSRRVEKVVGYPPLSEMGELQRREFHEALPAGPTPPPSKEIGSYRRSKRLDSPKSLDVESPRLPNDRAATRSRRGKGGTMQRRVVPILVVGACMTFGASTALAAPGAFPEQPGNNPQTACMAVTTNPGTGATGQAGEVISPTAGAITTGLIQDACFEG